MGKFWGEKLEFLAVHPTTEYFTVLNLFNNDKIPSRHKQLLVRGLTCATCKVQATHVVVYKENKSRSNGIEPGTHIDFVYWDDDRRTLLTIDHIHPRSAGGTEASSNLQVLCGHCNGIKSSMPDDEFKKIFFEVFNKTGDADAAREAISEFRAAKHKSKRHSRKYLG